MTGPVLMLLSVVIPARDEEGCICQTIEQIHYELQRASVAHEIIVVDDGSNDRTWDLLQELVSRIPQVQPVRAAPPHGFGRAVINGLGRIHGDAVVIAMADGSDSCQDIVRYWEELNKGVDCVFGSRFIRGGETREYPTVKLILNRIANRFIQILFGISLNDTTNAFKAYRREVIDGCRPLISPHFNLTVELPLKAIIRGFSWRVIPVSWCNRATGTSKLKIKEMGSRYLFICLYLWLEKHFTSGDYRIR